MPAASTWDRMVPTLRLANVLRERVLAIGGRGLRVAAAYRPTGGASRSQHKKNAALDLDLLSDDYHLTAEFYREAVRLWCEVGAELDVGLGLYCGAGRRGGIRVHIDTGARCRTWQLSGRAYIRPALAIKIAAELGLTAATVTDRLEGEGNPDTLPKCEPPKPPTSTKRRRKASAEDDPPT